MEELDDEPERDAPRRRGIPRWAWITCGSGCMLAMITIAVVTIAGYRVIRTGTDPEQQWPKLAEVLPYDERPEHLSLEFGFSIGTDQFHLRDGRTGAAAVITAMPDPGAVDALLDADPQTVFGMGGPLDPESGELELQGRTVRALRFSSIRGTGKEPGIRLDLGQRGKSWRVAELKMRQPPTDEDVQAFFEPFDVWRE